MKINDAWEWIKSIALAVIIAILIKTFIFNTTYVLGYSMYPTLSEKDRLFTSKIEYYIGEPDRGDIVILKAPDDPDKDYIKRVVGVAGDIIELKDGRVFVNGEVLNEDYIEEGTYTYPSDYPNDKTKWEVSQGYVFVLGDNRGRNASKDSRYLGCIPLGSIKGKAFFRYYPFNESFGGL